MKTITKAELEAAADVLARFACMGDDDDDDCGIVRGEGIVSDTLYTMYDPSPCIPPEIRGARPCPRNEFECEGSWFYGRALEGASRLRNGELPPGWTLRE